MCIIMKIENKRDELLKTAIKTGISSLDTLRCSKELDDLLIMYQRQNLNHGKGPILTKGVTDM